MNTPAEQIIYPETPFPLPQALIFLGRRGSEAYDLVMDKGPDRVQDRDLIGVCVPPITYYLGLQQWESAERIEGEWDIVLFEVRKFVRLLMQQNPNVLEAIWVHDEDVLSRSVEGSVLIGNRDIFRQDSARDRFLGYANGQLQKMTAFDKQAMEHLDYLEKMLKDAGIDPQHVVAEPPIKVPDRMSLVAADYRATVRKYRRARMGAKRWESVRQFGYDVKNASHLVRLLHSGHEYLTQGRLNVKRTWDREMLLEIKRGEWELARVQEHATEWMSKLETAKSVLPTSIDEHQVEQLLLYIIGNRLDLKG